MAEVQAKLEALSAEYQKLQEELQGMVSARQRLQSQQQENAGVFREFEKLAADETIYKLTGPVLLKQDKAEAKNLVQGRLDFMTKEATRLEGSIKDTQVNLDRKRTEIVQLQASAQAAAVSKVEQAA